MDRAGPLCPKCRTRNAYDLNNSRTYYTSDKGLGEEGIGVDFNYVTTDQVSHGKSATHDSSFGLYSEKASTLISAKANEKIV